MAAGAPKKVVHETAPEEAPVAAESPQPLPVATPQVEPELSAAAPIAPRGEDRNVDEDRKLDEERGEGRNDDAQDGPGGAGDALEAEEGPVHRPLIRAQLPRTDQPPPARPGPDFTIRQPTARHNRFRPRQQRGGQGFQGNRSGGNFSGNRGGAPHHGGRPPMEASRMANRHGQHGHQGHGRKRSK